MNPLASIWSNQPIVFVSGKGGVGKSLIAASVASQLAKSGRKVLLAELGDNSYYKDLWNIDVVGHSPVSVPGQTFDLALWSGETCLREYVLHYLRLERLYRLFFENKVMRALVNVAPGLNEIAVLGKIISGLRKVGPPLRYDVIVIDAYATGHAKALLQAPRGIMEAIKFGPMGHQSQEMDQLMRDPAVVKYLVVTLLEEMPVTETIEFVKSLKSDLNIEASVIANRKLISPVSESDLQAVKGADHSGLGEFAKYLCGVIARQKKMSRLLEENGLNVLEVPQVFSTHPDVLVEKVGEVLKLKSMT